MIIDSKRLVESPPQFARLMMHSSAVCLVFLCSLTAWRVFAVSQFNTLDFLHCFPRFSLLKAWTERYRVCRQRSQSKNRELKSVSSGGPANSALSEHFLTTSSDSVENRSEYGSLQDLLSWILFFFHVEGPGHGQKPSSTPDLKWNIERGKHTEVKMEMEKII